MVGTSERRRVQRVKLLEPLPGKIGGQRGLILDVSRAGIRVAHQESVGYVGDSCVVEFDWDGRRITAVCRITHTQSHRLGGAPHGRIILHTGFDILSISSVSEGVLREMIAWHVERALDEQKANARGIPAKAARSFQTGATKELMRHIYAAGRWFAQKTTDQTQPANGFTISASESAEEVSMLRTAWETSDRHARTLIQRMAELSISKSEGIPTRRYEP